MQDHTNKLNSDQSHAACAVEDPSADLIALKSAKAQEGSNFQAASATNDATANAKQHLNHSLKVEGVNSGLQSSNVDDVTDLQQIKASKKSDFEHTETQDQEASQQVKKSEGKHDDEIDIEDDGSEEQPDPFEFMNEIPIDDSQPQQNTWNLPGGIVVSTEFDSGNLGKCYPDESGEKDCFTCWMSGDSLPYASRGHYYTWFYFSVKGVTNGQTLTFNIKGMAAQGKLYKMGLRPVYRVSPNSMKWKRCQGALSWGPADGNFQIRFSHTFSNFNSQTDTAFFAWTYPYSFEQSLKYTQKLLRKFQNHDSIYIHREVLYYSRERRPMEMITFTSKTKMLEEREALIDECFPDANGDPNYRPYRFDKPTVFISSRVHPGETPASFVLDGIWKFLSDEKSAQGKVLRDRFVFKVVPMLNPDGVYRGYYRLDTLGQNLNRYYTNPSREKQPTIWAVKKAIKQQVDYNKICLYVDLHAHASKRGCFMFGNSLAGEEALKAMLLPKLISMNSLNFDFLECNFSDKMMNCKDKKDGLSREGCGRVSIGKLTNLPNCYTLECNYASGRTINRLTPKINKANGQVEAELPITDTHSKHYDDCYSKGQLVKNKAPPYTIEIFEDVGRAFCIGLLDFYDCNPISRIVSGNLKTLEGVEKEILSHYPIFIPKKREEEQKKELPPTGRARKPASVQRPAVPRGNLTTATQKEGREKQQQQGNSQLRATVPSRLSQQRDSRKLMKIGSAVIYPKNGQAQLKNQKTDPSSKIATQTTKPSLNSQSNQSSVLQQQHSKEPKLKVGRDTMKHSAVAQLVEQMNQKTLMAEQLKSSPKYYNNAENQKKELQMGSCAFFLDPERSAPRVKKNKDPMIHADLLQSAPQYQTQGSAVHSQPNYHLQRIQNTDINSMPLNEVVVSAQALIGSSADEIRQERMKTLNEIKSRVGSLRSKINANLQESGCKENQSELEQQLQMLKNSQSFQQCEENARQIIGKTTRYLVQNNRPSGGLQGIMPKQYPLSGDQSSNIFFDVTDQTAVTMEGAYGSRGPINQRNGARLSTKQTKTQKLKTVRPNFIMSRDNKQAMQDAAKILQLDASSGANNMVAMQQFRMPTPTQQDPSKIIAGFELQSLNQRQITNVKQPQIINSSAAAGKVIHSAQPITSKKNSMENTRSHQNHLDLSNLSDLNMAEHNRTGKHQNHMHQHKQQQILTEGQLFYGPPGGNLPKMVRKSSQRPERSSLGLGLESVNSIVHLQLSNNDFSSQLTGGAQGIQHQQQNQYQNQQQPDFYQHPFQTNSRDDKFNYQHMRAEAVSGVACEGFNTSTLVQGHRQPLSMKAGQNMTLPKITASVNASVSQYPTGQSNHTIEQTQAAQRTHHSMNNQRNDDDRDRSSNMHRSSLLPTNQSQKKNSVGSNRGRLSGSTTHMSPDERQRIQELRKKISEATKSSQQMHGNMLSPSPMPAKTTSSPRILDHPKSIVSSRKLQGIDLMQHQFTH